MGVGVFVCLFVCFVLTCLFFSFWYCLVRLFSSVADVYTCFLFYFKGFSFLFLKFLVLLVVIRNDLALVSYFSVAKCFNCLFVMICCRKHVCNGKYFLGKMQNKLMA